MGWGTLVTVGLFSLLSSLINGPLDVGKPVPTVGINFTRLKVPTPIEPPTRPEKPLREEPTLPPGPTGPGFGDSEVVRPGRGERTTVPTIRTGIPTGTANVGIDRDALPVVRVDPDYPPRALRGGIEGWVDVRFSVTATGAVRDVVVVDSSPKNVFDEAALKAVARWRYNPKVEGGVPVERIGMRTLIRFELKRDAQ
jgi:protein TonB